MVLSDVLVAEYLEESLEGGKVVLSPTVDRLGEYHSYNPVLYLFFHMLIYLKIVRERVEMVRLVDYPPCAKITRSRPIYCVLFENCY